MRESYYFLIQAGLTPQDAASAVKNADIPSSEIAAVLFEDWPIGDRSRDVEEARRGWWADPAVPFEYRRLLDAKAIDSPTAGYTDNDLPIKAVIVPPGYLYDKRANRYRNARTGQFVKFRQIYDLLGAHENSTLDKFNNINDLLYEGSITFSEWYTAATVEVRRLHVQNAALGAGGYEQLKPSDYMRIDEMLRDEMDRLYNFGLEIEAGDVSLAQMMNRANMYAGTARLQFYYSTPKPTHDPKTEMVLERRILRPADHCDLCVYLADLGWQEYGTLPRPGQSVADFPGSQCLSNCRCELEVAIFSKDEARAVLAESGEFSPQSQKAGDGHVCYGCGDAMKEWREEDHPRYPDGRFRPKDGYGHYDGIQPELIDTGDPEWVEAYPGQTPAWKITDDFDRDEVIAYYIAEARSINPELLFDPDVLDGIFNFDGENQYYTVEDVIGALYYSDGSPQFTLDDAVRMSDALDSWEAFNLWYEEGNWSSYEIPRILKSVPADVLRDVGALEKWLVFYPDYVIGGIGDQIFDVLAPDDLWLLAMSTDDPGGWFDMLDQALDTYDVQVPDAFGDAFSTLRALGSEANLDELINSEDWDILPLFAGDHPDEVLPRMDEFIDNMPAQDREDMLMALLMTDPTRTLGALGEDAWTYLTPNMLDSAAIMVGYPEFVDEIAAGVVGEMPRHIKAVLGSVEARLDIKQRTLVPATESTEITGEASVPLMIFGSNAYDDEADAFIMTGIDLPASMIRETTDTMRDLLGDDVIFSPVKIVSTRDYTQVEWRFNTVDKQAGKASIILLGDGTVSMDYLSLPKKNTGDGMALLGAAIQETMTAGFDYYMVYADISIGRYAWAKADIHLAQPDPALPGRVYDWIRRVTPDIARERFPGGKSDFLREYGDVLTDTPAVARFDLPGVTYRGSDIINQDVDREMDMHVGKAFMLDNRGMGNWFGFITLDEIIEAATRGPQKSMLDVLRDLGRNRKAVGRAAGPAISSRHVLLNNPQAIIPESSDLEFWNDWLAGDTTDGDFEVWSCLAVG